LKKLLLNLIFYPLFVAVTAGMFGFFLFPLLLIRPLIGPRRIVRIVRALILLYGSIVIRVLPFPFVRIRYKDYEKEKKRGACVYVCNHRSSSDGFLMANLNVEAVQVVNNWPFRIPIIGWVARVAGYLSVRTMAFEAFMKESCRLLGEGVSIIAFPEGSRSTDRVVNQFNGAVFRVAQAARVPVVPVCLSGNQFIPPKGTGILNPGLIKVHKLPALEWEFYKDWTPFKLKNVVREIIQSEVDTLEAV